MDINTPTPPPEGCISCEVRGHVLLIGINRPAKRNGWTPPMFQQLAEAYTRPVSYTHLTLPTTPYV